MQRTLSISKLQRKIFEQLETDAAAAVLKRDDFLRVVLAGHEIENATPVAFNDEGIVVEVADHGLALVAPDATSDDATATAVEVSA